MGSFVTRPALFLDVDGVLNAFNVKGSRGRAFPSFQEAKCNGFRIMYSLEMGNRLAALDVDIFWLTTWEIDDLCNKEIGPLFGWEPLPVIDRGEYDQPGQWWKSSAARDFIKGDNRPFIWLDDDLADAETLKEIEWVKDCGVPNLLISPNPWIGLTPRQIDKVEAFIGEQMT